MKALFIMVFGVCAILLPAQAQQQGIKGEVLWIGGNQLPGPGKVVNPKQGIQREVYFYKVTTLEKEGQPGPFFTSLKADFITKVQSKEDGTFKVKLPPGEYSVFVKENQGFFANLFESNGKINPVIVTHKQFAWITVTVDYEATY